jgi:hypothetical protein
MRLFERAPARVSRRRRRWHEWQERLAKLIERMLFLMRCMF